MRGSRSALGRAFDWVPSGEDVTAPELTNPTLTDNSARTWTPDISTPRAPFQEFHDHLDVCARCAGDPFNLCPEGELILAAGR